MHPISYLQLAGGKGHNLREECKEYVLASSFSMGNGKRHEMHLSASSQGLDWDCYASRLGEKASSFNVIINRMKELLLRSHSSCAHPS